MVCSECKAVYYRKSWHHDFRSLKSFESDLPLKFLICPADLMIRRGQYEGRIKIQGIPTAFRSQLADLIKSFCQRATDRDPMDRLIGIKKDGAVWLVTTTENQLANKLARKIKQVFNKVKTRTRFAGAPSDVVEITAEFIDR